MASRSLANDNEVDDGVDEEDDEDGTCESKAKKSSPSIAVGVRAAGVTSGAAASGDPEAAPRPEPCESPR